MHSSWSKWQEIANNVKIKCSPLWARLDKLETSKGEVTFPGTLENNTALTIDIITSILVIIVITDIRKTYPTLWLQF